MDALNLGDYCRHWARWRPDVDRRCGSTTAPFTWRELDERTDRLAAGFAARGVVQGDRVALLMGNRSEWVELTSRAQARGLTVPLNIRYSPAEVAYVVADAGLRLAVTEDALAAGHGVAGERHRRSSRCTSPSTSTRSAGRHDPRRSRRVDDDPVYLCYTSGTTGDPKGGGAHPRVGRRHLPPWAQCLPISFDDVFYLPFPLAVHGRAGRPRVVAVAGATLVLDRAFEPAGRSS